METKINIAELLKDCPQGMELDCTMFDDNCVEFNDIADNEFMPIRCRIKTSNGGYNYYNFTKYGCWIDDYKAKCVIFPKGKTTWEGFQRPFKGGDIIYICDECSYGTFTYVAILKQIGKGGEIQSHCFYNFEDDLFSPHDFLYDGHNIRFATEEEKEKLFKAIKENGYKWNTKMKILEKLITPKFKVGDRIRHKYIRLANRTIKSYNENIGYFTTMNNLVRIEFQDEWELVPNKFNITTLKPFESRVLVRDYDDRIWIPTFWGKHLGDDCNCRYLTTNGCYKYCIPYEGNEHLLGTTNDCEDFYKIWK